MQTHRLSLLRPVGGFENTGLAAACSRKVIEVSRSRCVHYYITTCPTTFISHQLFHHLIPCDIQCAEQDLDIIIRIRLTLRDLDEHGRGIFLLP
jgi:hypothetical protein